jgi:ankyrin repeat protein
LKAVDKDGRGLFHRACYAGFVRVLVWLVAQGEVGMSASDSTGTTPLHRAASEGHVEAMQWLMAQERVQEQATKMAAREIDWQEATKITSEASRSLSIHARDKDGCTALHFAAGKGHTDGVRMLLAEGAGTKMVNAADKNGLTSFHNAASSGQLDVMKLLTEKGADMHAVEQKTGDTPLPYMYSYQYTNNTIRIVSYRWHCASLCMRYGSFGGCAMAYGAGRKRAGNRQRWPECA